jgi:hypothetical protein
MTAYDDFRDKIAVALRQAQRPLTWTEIRTAAGLPQLYPNNQWVHRLESDIGLRRTRDAGGIIHWQISAESSLARESSTKAAEPTRSPSRRKQGAVE